MDHDYTIKYSKQTFIRKAFNPISPVHKIQTKLKAVYRAASLSLEYRIENAQHFGLSRPRPRATFLLHTALI